MASIKLTKRIVEQAQPRIIDGQTRQTVYFDSDLKGFGLLVGRTAKSFIAQRDVRGRAVRVTIGKYPAFSVDQARREAQQLLAAMARGVNPNEAKRQALERGITLEQAWALYEQTLRAKGRTGTTISGYRYKLETYLKDWWTRPLSEISRADVRARHKRIADDIGAGRYSEGRTRTSEHGPSTANHVMRAFRAVYNRAMREHESLPSNPTVNVDWYRSVPRKAALSVSQLHLWYAAVMAIENPIRRDFLRFALFTGLRRTNASEVRWEHVDFENRLLYVPKPKSQRAFDLPLSDFLIDLLTERKRENAEVFENSPWVFPSLSASGHIVEPKESFDGITWAIHDCRRWFITVAESLDVSPYALKLLVNHATPSGDVTGGYIQHEVERLRAPMQAITNRLIALCTPPEGKVASYSLKYRNMRVIQ